MCRPPDLPNLVAMNRIIIAALLCLLPALATADRIYTWTDDQGVRHYSDTPKDQRAEELTPDRLNLYQRFTAPVPEPAEPDPAADDPNAFPGYDRLAILSPGDEQVVRDNLGNVDVELALEPELQEGHRLVARINDEVRGEFERPRFTLAEVHRGTWALQVSVVDEEGRTLIESGTVTFFMHQASRHF